MRRKIIFPIIPILISLFILLVNFSVVKGQESEPTETAKEPISVVGEIINKNTSAPIQGSIEVMLHGWDQDFNQIVMLHGNSNSNGGFEFSDVPNNPSEQFAVMATYEDAVYFSELKYLDENESQLQFEVFVYESTNELEYLQLPQTHILFYPTQGGLGVTQIYILSNVGEKTVREAVSLENGQNATLFFELPENASNINFDEPDRFILFPNGFANTKPIPPNPTGTEITASFVLDYTDGMKYQFTPPLHTKELSILISENSGLILGDNNLQPLQPSGSTALNDGAQVLIYEFQNIDPEIGIEIYLTGELMAPSAATVDNIENPIKTNNNQVGYAGFFLGFLFIGFGLWVWRNQPGQENDQLMIDDLILEIAKLDISFEEGKLEQATYKNQRQLLINKILKNN